MPQTSVLADPDTALTRADAYARDPQRLAVLQQTGLLDTGLQTSLQPYVTLACELMDAPISTLWVIDAERQYCSAAHGIEIAELPLEYSYCKHTAAEDLRLSVADVRDDVVFAANPASASVRAYLGAPVRAGGVRIGALCVLDTEPHGWSDRDHRIIDDLAAAISADVEVRLMRDARRELRCQAA